MADDLAQAQAGGGSLRRPSHPVAAHSAAVCNKYRTETSERAAKFFTYTDIASMFYDFVRGVSDGFRHEIKISLQIPVGQFYTPLFEWLDITSKLLSFKNFLPMAYQLLKKLVRARL